MQPTEIAPLFKADNATLSFYVTKDGKISVSWQGWDQSAGQQLWPRGARGKGWPETRKFLPVSTRSYSPSLDTSVIRPLANRAAALEAMEADVPKRAARCHVRG